MDLVADKPLSRSTRRVRRVCRFALWVLVLLFILLNVLAYRHAGSFFYYSDGTERTPSPENLTWSQKFEILVEGISIPKPVAHASPKDWGLAFEDVVVHGRENYMLSGWFIPSHDEADVAVIFHGYNTEKSGLLPEASMFHQLGYNVVMVDFPGSGASPGNMNSLGIYEAEDVVRVLEWARNKWPARRIVLYGHSMGGAAIMRAMGKLGAKPDAAIVESVFDTLLHAIRQRFEILKVPSFPAAEMLLFWGSVQLGANGFAHDLISYAENVNVPVLISHGGKDTRAPIDGAKKVYKALSGPSEFLVMPEAAHVSPCLSDELAWRDAISGFLRNTIP